MRRNNILLLLGVVVLALSSCKKGENDPGLPFKTRRARLVNTWDFSTYVLGTKTTITNTSTSINRLEEIKDDDIIVNTTTTNPSASINIEEDGIVDRFVIEFTKSGEFLMVKEYSLSSSWSTTLLDVTDTIDGTTIEVDTVIIKTINSSKDIVERYEGNWNFLGRVEDEFENKERIALHFTEITNTQQNTIDTIIQTTITLNDGINTPVKEVDIENTRTTITSGVTDRYSNGEYSIAWQLSRLAKDQVIVEREIDDFGSTNIKTVINTDTNGIPTGTGTVAEVEGAVTTIGTETFILTPSGLVIEEAQ